MPPRLEKDIFLRHQDSSDSGIPPDPAENNKLGLDMSEAPFPIDSSSALRNTVLGLSGTFLTAARVNALNTIEQDIVKLVKNAIPEGADIAAQDVPVFTRTVLLKIIPTLERLWKSEKPDSPEEERLFKICQEIKKSPRDPLPKIAKDIYRRLDIPVPPENTEKPSRNSDYERELERLTRLLPPGTVSVDGHVYTEEELERTAWINIKFMAKGARQAGEKPTKSPPKKPKDDTKTDVEALLKRPHYPDVMKARNNGDSNDQIARKLGLNPHTVGDIASRLIQAKLIKNRGEVSEQQFTPQDLKALRLLCLTPQEEFVQRDDLTPMFYETDELKSKQLARARDNTPNRVNSLNNKLKRLLHLPPNADSVIVKDVQHYQETARYRIKPDFRPQVKEILEKNGIPISEELEEPNTS